MSKTIAYYIEKLDLEDLKLIRVVWNDAYERSYSGNFPDNIELSNVIFLNAKEVRKEIGFFRIHYFYRFSYIPNKDIKNLVNKKGRTLERIEKLMDILNE